VIIVPVQGWKVQIFGNNLNISKFCPGRNLEKIEVRECFLPFGAAYIVFRFANKKYKDIKNYNFTYCFVWL